jgi:hypothetical protein
MKRASLAAAFVFACAWPAHAVLLESFKEQEPNPYQLPDWNTLQVQTIPQYMPPSVLRCGRIDFYVAAYSKVGDGTPPPCYNQEGVLTTFKNKGDGFKICLEVQDGLFALGLGLNEKTESNRLCYDYRP